jgi:hypothetical protein
VEGRENIDTECVHHWSTTVSGAGPVFWTTTAAKPVVLSTSLFSCSGDTHALRKLQSLPTRVWAGWTYKAAMRVRKKVLTVVLTKSQNFCAVTLWRLVNRYWPFEGYIQGPAVRQFEIRLRSQTTTIFIILYICAAYSMTSFGLVPASFVSNHQTFRTPTPSPSSGFRALYFSLCAARLSPLISSFFPCNVLNKPYVRLL